MGYVFFLKDRATELIRKDDKRRQILQKNWTALFGGNCIVSVAKLSGSRLLRVMLMADSAGWRANPAMKTVAPAPAPARSADGFDGVARVIEAAWTLLC
jgi:hypothetical protein